MIIKGHTIFKGTGGTEGVNLEKLFTTPALMVDSYMTGFKIGLFSSAVVFGAMHLAKHIHDQAKRTEQEL